MSDGAEELRHNLVRGTHDRRDPRQGLLPSEHRAARPTAAFPPGLAMTSTETGQVGPHRARSFEGCPGRGPHEWFRRVAPKIDSAPAVEMRTIMRPVADPGSQPRGK